MVRKLDKFSGKQNRIVLLCALSVQLGCAPAFAQMGALEAGSSPIDIQANEQEFGEGHVIAKGNVKVTYKDSIVYAPMATLYRDANGTAQRAVFTGHPHLVQGSNKIDANTLVFEIASQKIIADGNAHSEVLQAQSRDEETPEGKDAKDGKGKAGKNSKAGKAKTTAKAAEPTPPQKIADENTPSPASEMADAASTGSDTTPSMEKLMAAPPASKKPAAPKNAPPEKIITDSNHQEYVRSTGQFNARGNVHVKHGDITVTSDTLQLVYGSDRKPETALFTGHVSATQNENNTQSDIMTYYLTTQRLQATGNVRSKVIQKKADGAKKGGPSGEANSSGTVADQSKSTDKSKLADKSKGFSFDMENGNGDPIFINSEAQDYTKDSGRVEAQGNVHVYYGDTTGIGPNAVLIRNSDGQAEKVIFTGRSQISQPGKRWIGDKITMTVNDRKVLAEGNTRAFILQTPGKDGKPSTNPSPTMPGFGTTKRAPIKLPDSGGQVAGKKMQQASSEPMSKSRISTSKIEAAQ